MSSMISEMIEKRNCVPRSSFQVMVFALLIYFQASSAFLSLDDQEGNICAVNQKIGPLDQKDKSKNEEDINEHRAL